jgi:phenylpropionate dioxygenase-like ring-hydroxylating dioxygenase large terminal subunit
MLTTQQPVLRRFWYATIPLHDLKDGPKPFRLMGQDIVLFVDSTGAPHALRDRCCHRTAKLSKGWCDGDTLVCGYHGWRYDGTGAVVAIPQSKPDAALPSHKTEAYHCQGRYGYAWVALDEPLADLFDIPEDRDPGFRRIFQFYDQWNTAPLRLMENSFDNAHFSFVHRATFGDATQPVPKVYRIEETDYGFEATTIVDVMNPPNAHEITGDTSPTTTRTMRNHWYLPFSRRMDMLYPSGIRHIIINCATPIEDGRIQLIQLLYRNDREGDCSTEKLIAWDRAIVEEDRDILEATDCDAIVDISRRIEVHMQSDRPGLIMRRRLLQLLRDHGEEETSYQPASKPPLPGI